MQPLCFPPQHLLSIRSFLYAAYILSWTLLLNACSSLPVGLWVCGWDIHPVLLPSGCSWHAWLNVKLSCNMFPPLIYFLPNRPLGCLDEIWLFPCNIVDKAIMLERKCSAAHRAMIKSNCMISISSPLPFHRHPGTRSRTPQLRLGTLYERYIKHQPYSPTLSLTKFVALHAYPFLLWLGHSDRETPERPGVALLNSQTQTQWSVQCSTYCVSSVPHTHDQWQD